MRAEEIQALQRLGLNELVERALEIGIPQTKGARTMPKNDGAGEIERFIWNGGQVVRRDTRQIVPPEEDLVRYSDHLARLEAVEARNRRLEHSIREAEEERDAIKMDPEAERILLAKDRKILELEGVVRTVERERDQAIACIPGKRGIQRAEQQRDSYRKALEDLLDALAAVNYDGEIGDVEDLEEAMREARAALTDQRSQDA